MKTLLSALLLAGIALAAAPDSVCDRAAWLLFNRHLDPGHFEESYNLLAGARAAWPENERVLYLWSRIHIQKGDDATTRADKFRCYGRSKAVAESLLALNPNNADAHMWWGVAQGRIGQTRGVMNSLFMVPSLKREFGKAMELDPQNATAYDAYGVLYYELPGIAGGDLRRSEEYLVKGLNIDPNYTVIRLDLAKVYVRQKRWSEAREQLRLVLNASRPTYPADWALDDRPEAEALLRQIADR